MADQTQNEEYYDKIQETDRSSVRGLSKPAPGRPLSMILHHADGLEDQVQVNRSLNVEQIEWFKAGTALNVLERHGARTADPWQIGATSY